MKKPCYFLLFLLFGILGSHGEKKRFSINCSKLFHFLHDGGDPTLQESTEMPLKEGKGEDNRRDDDG